jgi:RecA/RadA recombinase
MARKKPSLEALETAIEEAEDSRSLPLPNLSLGCEILNLAVSGDYRKAIGPGTYMFYCGSSGSGKSFLTLTMFAEACRNPFYDDYELIFFDKERGAGMSLAQYFGKKAASRIVREDPASLEAFYDRIDALNKAGKKFIGILDSFDALQSEKFLKKVDEQAKQREKDKEVSGDYGMANAKTHSQRLPEVVSGLAKTGSILCGISQVRDNPDAGMFGPKTKRSGGHALKYYSTLCIETSVGSKITKEVNGKPRVIGVHSTCKIEKNRINGKDRKISLIFVPGVGIDSLGTTVDYLLEEKHWVTSGGRINCPLFEKTYYREELIGKIEDEGREDEVYQEMQACWDGIEEACRINRKPRFE